MSGVGMGVGIVAVAIGTIGCVVVVAGGADAEGNTGARFKL
jgi:hypothetical protein